MVGIDAASFYVPKLFVPIEKLAEARNIPYEKLNRGLGLKKMAIPDVNEDAASFAANALMNIITTHEIDPKTIGRIYLGTESAVDGSKPTATYALEPVENLLKDKYGERCFKNCDVVDFTFACIGAVDAMQTCLDWIKAGTNRKAIVIASDLSKYDLNSTGEYTQGAGAVALLLSENPSILAFNDSVGVGMQSVGDFFKPRRIFSKKQVAEELVKGLSKDSNNTAIEESIIEAKDSFWGQDATQLALYKEEPVFDGQYSNNCYQERITEAFKHFQSQENIQFDKDWEALIFHLPYAYHGRRIIFDNWLQWIQESNTYNDLLAEVGNPEDEEYKDWKRKAVKSNLYKSFVAHKIAPSEKASSEIGNMYTASIFMALLSTLASAHENGTSLTDKKFGFIAYGSGSKAKVFEGTIQKNWRSKVEKINLFGSLENRTPVDIETYSNLHTGAQNIPVSKGNENIVLKHVENEIETKLGLRNYALNQA